MSCFSTDVKTLLKWRQQPVSCENSVLSMANASFSGQCSRSNQSVFILAFSHFLSHHIFDFCHSSCTIHIFTTYGRVFLLLF